LSFPKRTRCKSHQVAASLARLAVYVAVEDPVVLAEPWVIPTRTLRLNTNADAGLVRERGNCETYEDEEDIVTQIRH
jgi:hypothetical protein